MKKVILRNSLFTALLIGGLTTVSCKDNNRADELDNDTEIIDNDGAEFENDMERRGDQLETAVDTIEEDIDRAID